MFVKGNVNRIGVRSNVSNQQVSCGSGVGLQFAELCPEHFACICDLVVHNGSKPYPTTTMPSNPRIRPKGRRNQIGQAQAETRSKSETQPDLQEAGLEANRLLETGPEIEERAPEIDLTQAAEPLVEISQEPYAIIDKGPEIYESYELPVADLELLLVELDANPLEPQPEKNIEAEPVREQ